MAPDSATFDPVAFDFAALRRFPDVEASNLFAVDASDRLILDEAAASFPAERLVVIEDRYGALTLGAAALFGATGIRVHQDALSGEAALALNADKLGLKVARYDETDHYKQVRDKWFGLRTPDGR